MLLMLRLMRCSISLHFIGREGDKLLQPFEEATEDINSDSSPSALFIPIVNSTTPNR